MILDAACVDRPVEDSVSDVLKWVLLVVAIGTSALLVWASTVTYQTAPPQPDRFVAANGTVLMTGDDIAAGKGGSQKADLMDYGSLSRHGISLRRGLHRFRADNCSFEPLVGNTPTTNTSSLGPWISFCFTFFALGVVLFIYEFFLNNPDDAPCYAVLFWVQGDADDDASRRVHSN